MKRLNIVLLLMALSIFFVYCDSNENRVVEFFKDTEAYSLSKAVIEEDLEEIEKLVEGNHKLLEMTEPVSGSNVLVLSIYFYKLESFRLLLELGANPNFINPFTKYSVLISAVESFGGQYRWSNGDKYVELLLEYGADPNYAVEKDFTDVKRNHILATSPLMKASALDLELVKTLIRNGADPYKKLIGDQSTPFSEAVSWSQYDIIYYYIDSLNVNIHQPMCIVQQLPDSIEKTFYIQDYIKTKLMLKKLRDKNFDVDNEVDIERWELIQYLQSKGVDFVNYDYLD